MNELKEKLKSKGIVLSLNGLAGQRVAALNNGEPPRCTSDTCQYASFCLWNTCTGVACESNACTNQGCINQVPIIVILQCVTQEGVVIMLVQRPYVQIT
jgi:hypothetical protein